MNIFIETLPVVMFSKKRNRLLAVKNLHLHLFSNETYEKDNSESHIIYYDKMRMNII